MLISVIIPVFRAQGTLARAVRSALMQTHRDLDIVIVADDDHDYRGLLQVAGIDDDRLHYVSPCPVGSGCQARLVAHASRSWPTSWFVWSGCGRS